eukprot:12320-Heterococcus_DN1.PRE.4
MDVCTYNSTCSSDSTAHERRLKYIAQFKAYMFAEGNQNFIASQVPCNELFSLSYKYAMKLTATIVIHCTAICTLSTNIARVTPAASSSGHKGFVYIRGNSDYWFQGAHVRYKDNTILTCTIEPLTLKVNSSSSSSHCVVLPAAVHSVVLCEAKKAQCQELQHRLFLSPPLQLTLSRLHKATLIDHQHYTMFKARAHTVDSSSVLSDAGVLQRVFSFLPGNWLYLGAVCRDWVLI